mgnify:CR=1 FL=1
MRPIHCDTSFVEFPSAATVSAVVSLAVGTDRAAVQKKNGESFFFSGDMQALTARRAPNPRVVQQP